MRSLCVWSLDGLMSLCLQFVSMCSLWLLILSNPLLAENLGRGPPCPMVFFTARVHPGETPASYVCQGTWASHLESCMYSVELLSLSALLPFYYYNHFFIINLHITYTYVHIIRHNRCSGQKDGLIVVWSNVMHCWFDLCACTRLRTTCSTLGCRMPNCSGPEYLCTVCRQ